MLGRHIEIELPHWILTYELNCPIVFYVHHSMQKPIQLGELYGYKSYPDSDPYITR